LFSTREARFSTPSVSDAFLCSLLCARSDLLLSSIFSPWYDTAVGITKVVCLDMGGTLLDLAEPEVAYAEILERHGYPSTRDQILSWIRTSQVESGGEGISLTSDFTISGEVEGTRRKKLISIFLREAGVDKHLEDCREEIWQSWLKEPVFRLFPETKSVLAGLKEQGLVLGAISNWEPRLAQLCENLGIAGFFDFFVVSELEGHAKPSVRLFETALEKAGVEPREVLHVGDDLAKDIEPAEKVGMRGVLIQRDGSLRRDHSPRISTLRALLPLAQARFWMRGEVVSGKREAADFTQLAWVRKQFREEFGFEPYPGTLNLRLETSEDLTAWAKVRQGPGAVLEPEPGFCAGRCYPLSVEGQISAAAVFPSVPSYPEDIVEILSPVALRERLGLSDGMPVTIVFE
jgi:FMN phosphatase YigB (HAD superfamily)